MKSGKGVTKMVVQNDVFIGEPTLKKCRLKQRCKRFCCFSDGSATTWLTRWLSTA